MKTLFLAVVGLVFGAASLHADLTVVQRIEGLGQSTEAVTKCKDGKTRTDVSPGSTFISNPATGETISLLHAQKRYLKAPAEVVQAAADGQKSARPHEAGDAPKLVASGRKETIAGYAAEEYTATVSGVKIAFWLTQAIANHERMSREFGAALRSGPLAVMTQTSGLELAELPGFPVRIVSEPRSGQAVTFTLVSLSADSLQDADFEVPAGYEAITRPELTPRAAVSPGPKPTAAP